MVPTEDQSLDVESAVRARYSEGAKAREEALCCPVPADPAAFEFLPREVIEKDYGCGDPTSHVREGDVVLDLGSGAGRVCFVAAKKVGPHGRVIGVDMNDDMLAVARRHVDGVAEKLGYQVVEFKKARIQDLALDVDRVEAFLTKQPVGTIAELARLEEEMRRMRRDAPLIPDDSVDLVVSNCVLNLVRDSDKHALFTEIFRVLKRGGRIAISDIVVDEELAPAMKNDPVLWSGCLSGALVEPEFLRAFERVGFYGVEIAQRSESPWRVVDGYEFRSVTVTARKGKEGPCLERRQAVIYRGPWREVLDDDGHRLTRGERVAVCDKTFRILTSQPYATQIIAVPPHAEVPLAEAGPFSCAPGGRNRHPRETKGEDYRESRAADANPCRPGECC